MKITPQHVRSLIATLGGFLAGVSKVIANYETLNWTTLGQAVGIVVIGIIAGRTQTPADKTPIGEPVPVTPAVTK